MDKNALKNKNWTKVHQKLAEDLSRGRYEHAHEILGEIKEQASYAKAMKDLDNRVANEMEFDKFNIFAERFTGKTLLDDVIDVYNRKPQESFELLDSIVELCESKDEVYEIFKRVVENGADEHVNRLIQSNKFLIKEYSILDDVKNIDTEKKENKYKIETIIKAEIEKENIEKNRKISVDVDIEK